jgi:hypothetical protein
MSSLEMMISNLLYANQILSLSNGLKHTPIETKKIHCSAEESRYLFLIQNRKIGM